METENNKILFDLIRNHSVNFLEMAFRTDYREQISHPDGYGWSSNGCGDTVAISLIVRNETIQSVSLEINGCINTIACANTVAFMAEGKKVSRAWGITPQMVVDFLETLPPKEMHCAELSVAALRGALVRFMEIRRAPWKKLYA